MSDRSTIALVVDDSRVNRLVLVRQLAGLGVEAIEAEHGAQALDMLREHPGLIELVLLDVEMPELDGYETLAAMQADDVMRHIPVLMVSALEELDSVVRCIELGATDYMTKPINTRILDARVSASLAAKHLHDIEHEHFETQRALNETIERQRAELARYLSPQVASLVSSPDGEQLLAGHRREITAAFCDLRGFTSFAEQADPEELLGVLGEYHAMIGEAMTEHGGTLEHFAGDGVMIFFNDPIEVDKPAERAIRMALALQDAYRPISDAWAKLGHEVGLGIGIAQGDATLGVIGFEQRWEYAAIGNVPNLAARLCGSAHAGEIILDGQTEQDIVGVAETEFIGALTLRGFQQPVPAFRLKSIRS
jgi:adenylate cyclase